MPESFSFNREFDFVRLDGLRRATGRPPHEWDVYIVKELIDNALDADDALRAVEPARAPRVSVRMEYIGAGARPADQFFVRVSNLAPFPVEQLGDIFATSRYTSRKAFVKGLTRGSLGNALKTLLGIPYALRNRVAGDWLPDMNPLTLRSAGHKYQPRYDVDATAQTIRLECSTGQGTPGAGTEISVGLDYFEQEVPRHLVDIQWLAAQYHLCNPHASFRWAVEIEGELWEAEYEGDPSWAGKFHGVAPVHWYSLTAFRDLLGALYRQRFGGRSGGSLRVEEVATKFAGYEPGFRDAAGRLARIAAATKEFGQKAVRRTEIDNQPVTRLYAALCRYGPKFDTAELGAIGEAHIGAVMADALPCTSPVLYERITNGDDPQLPFVIEAAVVSLNEGKRQLWTAINFAPTYDDPFLSRWLLAPVKDDEAVLGLRGVLDAYDVREDVPAALFLHLICPNVEHHEFSKTEINHLPFKQALGRLLDRLLVAFVRAREEEELRLEQTAFDALETILSEIGEDERFVFDQLLEKLRARLGASEALAAWLETPHALGRLQACINNYQSRNVALTHRVARPAAGAVSLPLHPDRHISVLPEYLSRDLLAEHQVNKLLYVQVRELESVVLNNGWLCRMDMALLHNSAGPDQLRDALVRCAAGVDLIMLLHDDDAPGRALAEEARGWLADSQLDPGLIVDLGLGPDERPPLTRLVQMMPGELHTWLAARFESLGVECKMVPPVSDIRRDIRERFERLLLSHLWEGVSRELAVTRLVEDIDSRLAFTAAMRERRLDEALRHNLARVTPAASYTSALDRVVGNFFTDFMREHGASVEAMVREHLARTRGDGRTR